MSDLLFPIYEFRPIYDRPDKLYRYADGAWIPDDGEYDLAFFADVYAFYVELPYHQNIVWGWYDKHWSAQEPRHPRSNAWHYALREGATDWGDAWGKDRHPNEVAGRKAMTACSARRGCANGRGADLTKANLYLERGLIRRRDTKEIVKPPAAAACMYCGDQAPHLRCEALEPSA